MSQWVHLQDYVVWFPVNGDCSIYAFKRNCRNGLVYRVVKTENNDRSRSRLTIKDQLDFYQQFQKDEMSEFA